MSQSASIDEKAYTAELNREAGIPLYRQLEKRFCAMLQEGTLTHGEQLPSEAELMEQYGVSRTTVRLALKELEGKGLICRERGRGTYVSRTKIEHPTTVVTSFTEDITNRGERPGSITLFAEPIFPSATLAAKLRISQQARVIKLERIRTADGEPVGLHISHLVGALVPGLDLEELKENDISLYSILRREVGLSWGEAIETLEARLADERQRHLLLLPKGAPVLYIERLTMLRNGAPFEFSQMIYRADRYKSTVRLYVEDK